jgi:hypothetical protein
MDAVDQSFLCDDKALHETERIVDSRAAHHHPELTSRLAGGEDFFRVSTKRTMATIQTSNLAQQNMQ